MRHTFLYTFCSFALLFAANSVQAQKAVGDTLQRTTMAGGSITVPEGEEWRFLSLHYSEVTYGMAVKWEGPDTLKAYFNWVAAMAALSPSWSLA